jgi:hypothetical protein
MVTIPIYAIHHDPKIYKNPETFDPERYIHITGCMVKAAKRGDNAFSCPPNTGLPSLKHSMYMHSFVAIVIQVQS